MSEKQYIVGQVPQRTLQNGLFPFSPRANAREGIFSDVLAAVMGCQPQATFDQDFKARFQRMDVDAIDVADDVDIVEIWDVYEEKYTGKTQGESLIAVPFNVEIPKRIEPASSMQWGTWYRLHMSQLDGDTVEFEEELHQKFKDELDSQEPSNIFEELILEVVKTLPLEEQSEEDELDPIRPYIPAVHDNFSTDLNAWLNNSNVESDSDLLRDCQDLIGIHFFMYYVQVGLNLREEWAVFTDPDQDSIYSPEIIPIPFGIESEPASLGRPFVQIWEGEQGAKFSVKDALFDSWAHLSVTRILNEAITETHDDPPNYALTLTESQARMEEDSRRAALEKLYSHIADAEQPESATDEDLIEGAEALANAIDNHYRYVATDVAPKSMVIRGVKRLADADTRYLKRERGRPGFRLQMADETLAFLARVFTWDPTREQENRTFRDFMTYLKDHGFDLDNRSQRAAQESLDSMGLLEQESDSGESVNVRSY